MHSLRLCVFLAFVAGLGAYDLSPVLSEFYCMYSGEYSNIQQWQTHDEIRSLLYLKVVPIEIPGLSKLPVLYVEQAADGEIALMELGIITEIDGATVALDPFNYTGNSGYKPGTFDPRVLKTMSWDQVQGQPICRDVYTRTKQLTFDLRWTDCRHADITGKHYVSDATLTCNNITAKIPKGFSEIHTRRPYLLKLQGPKYPLPNPPNGYVCNCDNKKGSGKQPRSRSN
ncbi:unnamed protein product [Candidula unifasciata]|uniref:Uncharacterized protein n=1 Tax=Candidula unifasciata TaxID=100452 RepID=A0A8S3Z553_9EUPU|nr:unnamed protein product [Candidula unifasciata]